MAVANLLIESKWTLATALVAIYIVRRWYVYNRLRHIKGPPTTGLFEFWHSLAFLSERCHEWYTEANHKYGPMARVGPNAVITSSPEAWVKVNAVRSPYKRTKWFYRAVRIEPGKDNIFSQIDDAAHEKRRKQMAPGYSGKENQSLESDIDAHIQTLIRLIRSKYISTDTETKPMDLAKKIQYFTLDVISTVGLGKSFGMLEEDRDVDDYIKSGEEGLHIINFSVGVGISWILQTPWVAKLIGPSQNDAKGYGKMIGTAFRYVDERAAKPIESKSDMLASFIRHGLTGEELRSEALEQVLAGSDTTATGIRGILLYLITNPIVYGKLQNEIDNAVSTGNAPASPGIISLAEATKLPYLQAVVREGLRIWPPVVDIFPRDVPPGGDTFIIDDRSYFLPGGTEIGYSAHALHRDKGLYGEDADHFRPERWLTKDKSKLAAMIRSNELIFGHGKFHCLGKPVAQLELHKVIFELLRNFDWGLVSPEKPWKTQNLMGLFVTKDMWVHVTAR